MRRSLLRFFSLSLACCLISTLTVTGAEKTYEVEVRTDVKIPMRDSVQLSANIFLPKAEGKWPVILMRSPYGKGNEKHGDGLYYAANGYVFISQDCRGKGQSQGPWEPFANEADDGLDTHKWILDQPWCDGAMGTAGGSYVGFTQWASAPEAGDYLKAMFPVVPLIDPHGDIAYIDGAFSLSLMMGWGTLVSTPPDRLTDISKWDAAAWLKAYRALPLKRWDRVLGFKVQYLRDWVEHQNYDTYWSARSVRDRLSKIRVPICAVGGWYDIFAKSTLDHVNTVKTSSRSRDARRHQYVLMGPWTHAAGNAKVGDIDFGKDSAINFREIQTLWFDHWLKSKANGVDQWSPLRIFVMGRNQWRDEGEWPLERTRYTKYYFHSRGRANTSDGNGTLNTTGLGDESPDKFVYNPDDPVPTLGGCNLFGCPAGPRDQTEAEARSDVLVFTSRELTTELEITGPVKVILYSATSAPDTDWTAKLVDVHPDGRPFNLCDGIVRASWSRKSKKLEPIEPDKIYQYEIDLWVTSNVFLPGHKIRVEISSSNFPRFDRNLNTGKPFGSTATWKKANQTIYHDSEHPSHILLPVIP